MSKKTETLPFDLTNVTAAFADAERAANSFDAMCADMISWHEAGVYPTNEQVKQALLEVGKWKAGTCNVYAMNLLKWAKSGQTPKNVHQTVNSHPKGHVKSKAGRKPGTTGGSQAQVKASEASEAQAETDPRQFIRDLLARSVKIVDVADVDRFTNAGLEMIALMSKKMGKTK